jgi:amino acid adenylation domain-containing protein/non-ribosomal peptide synthase protein (TIGR01720 family)
LTLAALLERLRAGHVTLRLDGGRLRFEAPRGTMTDDLRDAVAAYRPELIALLSGSADDEIPRTPGDGPWPLSFAQRRLWFVEQIPELGPAYTICGAARIEGPLDEAALQTALTALGEQHPALRTGIEQRGGEPVQFVDPGAAPRLETLDLSQLPAVQAERGAAAALDTLAAHRFDLARPPLTRALLVRLATDRHLFALAQHHSVSDGWTISLLLRDLSRFYAAALATRALPVEPAALRYGDFASWQQSEAQRAELEARVAAQRQLLRDAPPCLELPADRARPPVQSFRGALVRGRIDAPLAERVRALARGERATTFMALLALFATVLHRYSGADDLVVGTAVAGRDRPELAALAGLFVNTVPIRCRFHAGMDGRALLRAAREAVLAALEQQSAPFERVVDAVAPERDPRYAPVCQVLISLQNALTEQLAIEGARVVPVRLENATCKVDLFLSAEETDEGAIDLELEYCTDLFDPDRMERMLRHLTTLAAAIAGDPAAPIDRHDLRDAGERALIARWNDTARALPPEASVHGTFSALAARQPDAVALVATSLDGGAQTLTYGALEKRSAGLAARLQAAGVRPGDTVAVFVPRGLSLAVALLGVLRAGAAYVPLDTDRPDPRIGEIVAGARPRAIVAEDADAVAPWNPGLPVVDPRAFDAAAATPPHVSPESCAYVMYTSGSTGSPKGVRVTHRNVLRLVAGLELDAAGPRQAILHAAPVAFDAATFELWGALLTGRTVVIAPPGALDTSELAAAIARHEVGTVWLTAGLFHRMADEHLDVLARLTQLYAGGDVLSPVHVQRVLDRMAELGNVRGRLINGYGPTECTTFTTLHVMAAGTTVPAPVPIGKPIANTTLHVLDRNGVEVPVGVPGELVVGGDGVALGYLADPVLTRERFVDDPERPGQRRYVTGDLVRRRSDGTLEFIGRLDQQIKIRGFRIELGEIEAVLLAQPGVRDAVVVAETDGSTKRLLAYVCTDGSQDDCEALFDALAARLPDYMLPAAITAVDVLPLGKNGKVDRAALPRPAPRARAREGSSPEALGPAGEALATIWREVLGVAPAGADDNFFRCGGDSLLAMRVVSAMTQAGWKISVRDILTHQRFADLARAARALVPEAPLADAAAFAAPALTPIQHAFFARPIARRSHWNQAVLLDVHGLDAGAVAAALKTVVARHDALRQRFTQSPGAPVAVRIAPHAEAPLYVVDLRALDAAEAAEVQARRSADVHASFDLAEGPLFAGAWFERGTAHPPQLLLVAHHLCVDAVSWPILIEDIVRAARGTLGGPPALTFSAWSSRWAQAAQTPSDLRAYESWPAAPRLARDDAGAACDDEAAALTATIELDAARTGAFLRDANLALRTEPTELLLAAVARALSVQFGADAVRIDLERHGRDALPELDASGVVGWFTALVPLRLSCGGGVLDLLREVKRRVRELPQRGLSWGALRHLCADPAVREAAGGVGVADCAVNFLGVPALARDAAAVLVPSDGPLGPCYAPGARRSHAFEVVAVVTDGRLRVDLRYDPAAHAGPALARGIEDALRAIVDAACDPAAGGVDPDDLPPPAVDAAALAAVVSRLGPGADGRHPARRIEAAHRLSHQQQGMLFESLLDGGSDLHVEQLAIALDGELDAARLERAWRETARRHPILRTAFYWQGLREPVAVVVDDALPRLERRADGEGSLDAQFAAERAAPLALDRPGVFRLALVEGAASRRLLWTFHHILLDGWSVALVLRDVARAYRAYRALAAETAAAPAPPSYARYVAWLDARSDDEAQAFWADELAGFVPRTLRGDAPSAEPGYAERVRALPSALARRIASAAAATHVSVNTLFQAAWGITAARAYGTRSAIVGTTVSGRPQSLHGIDESAGLFIDTLPFRVDVPERGATPEWLRALQLRHARVREHGHVPLASIAQWAGIALGAPLFEMLLVFENYPRAQTDDEALDVTSVAGRGARTRYPLTLLVVPHDGELRLQLVYDRGRFGDASAAALLDALERTLDELASQPRLEALAFDPLPFRSEPLVAPAAEIGEAPASATEAAVRAVWETIFPFPVARDRSFFELGGNSLLVVTLALGLRDRFGPGVEIGALLAAPTIAGMAALLDADAVPSASVTLLTLASGDARGAPVVIVPGASGNATAYAPLAERLPGHTVLGLQLLGVPAPWSVPELALRLVDALEPGPVHLVGHSFGAAVAFEAARILVARGTPPAGLILVDLPAPPHAASGDGGEAALLASIADAAGRFFGRDVALDRAALEAADGAQRRALFLAALARAGIAPENAGARFVEELVGSYRASLDALARWDPRPLDVPFAAIVRAAESDATGVAADPSLGWRALLGRSETAAFTVPGDHITMITPPHVAAFAALLERLLTSQPVAP